jgi:mannose/fructose-specific phosphotransferase system component IIA
MSGQSIAIVLVTHGLYGRVLVESAEAIVGPLDIAVVEVPPDGLKSCADVRAQILSHIERQKQERGVLLITDLWGATPCNACQSLLGEHSDWEVLTGLNLPMLMKLATCDRTLGAADVAQRLRSTSIQSILVASAPRVRPKE